MTSDEGKWQCSHLQLTTNVQWHWHTRFSFIRFSVIHTLPLRAEAQPQQESPCPVCRTVLGFAWGFSSFLSSSSSSFLPSLFPLVTGTISREKSSYKITWWRASFLLAVALVGWVLAYGSGLGLPTVSAFLSVAGLAAASDSLSFDTPTAQRRWPIPLDNCPGFGWLLLPHWLDYGCLAGSWIGLLD